MEEIINKIAQEELFIATLETRNWDRLDFHEISVWGIKKALERAYKAGQENVLNKKNNAE